jgi:hypothetical protein
VTVTATGTLCPKLFETMSVQAPIAAAVIVTVEPLTALVAIPLQPLVTKAPP